VTGPVVARDPGRPAGWIDSHCHLQDTYRPEEAELPAVLAEAAAAGVGGVVCVGTDAATSRQAVDLAAAVGDEAPGLRAWATVGLHPHDAATGVDAVARVLEESLAAHPGTVVAVGECGLDYHYEHSPRAAQRDAFAAQIALAKQHRRTLVVHSRSAWDDTFDVLQGEGAPERVVFHCFTGGPDEARRCLELGAYVSISGIVTFKNAQDVRDAVVATPLDRLLVETDAPFLAPVPHRGEQNRPALVAVVGEAVAALKGLEAAVFAEISASLTEAAFALV